jgi:hypothetical protein
VQQKVGPFRVAELKHLGIQLRVMAAAQALQLPPLTFDDKRSRFAQALGLCRAFWPARWSETTLAAAGEMHECLAPETLPEGLDEIEARWAPLLVSAKRL